MPIAPKWSRVILVALFMAGDVAALGAIPGADNSKAFTQRDYGKALLAFNRRTLSEAYQSAGKKDPKWDAAAIKFLDEMALRFTMSSIARKYGVAEQKSSQELLQLASAAIDAGCDDPLVTYCRAVVLDDEKHRRSEVRPIVEKAAEQLLKGTYPVNRAQGAYRRLYRLSEGADVRQRETLWGTWRDLSVAMAVHWKIQDLDRRIVLDQMWDEIEADGIEMEKSFIEQFLAQPAGDEWIREVILGRHEINLAWAARGKGLANTVSPDAWKQFYKHLSAARDHLRSAHKLRPQDPEAAAAMITVSTGAGDEFHENARQWFEKSVAAQLDYLDAYNRYVNYLLPRWHGSIREMYDYAVECFDTRRFDTIVPWEYQRVLNLIVDEAGLEFYRTPGVYEHVRELADQSIANPYPLLVPAEIRSQQMAFAWRARQFDEAARLWDELGEKFDERAFGEVRAMGRLAASHAYAMHEKLADAIEGAESRATSGDLAGAANVYQQALTKVAPTSKSQYFLRSRLKQLQWQQQFEKGEWVDIQPDKDFIGWQPMSGKWRVDDQGGLVGEVESWGLWMICQAAFLQGDFAIEWNVELPVTENVTSGGVGFCRPAKLLEYWGAFVRRNPQQGFFDRDFYPDVRDPVDLQPVNRVVLEVHEGLINGQLNGKQLFQNHPADILNDRYYLGVGNRQPNKGAQCRITGLRVRKSK